MLWVGLMLALGSAAIQSLAYLLSRMYTVTGRGGKAQLLVMSHALQGVVCIPLLALLWPADLPPLMGVVPAAAGVAGSYLAGQVFLFITLHRIDASRISPLLGLKVAMLAVLCWVLLGQRLMPSQWAGVALAGVAASLLNRVGGRLPGWSQAAVGLTCFGYAMSDVFIDVMIRAMHPVPPVRAGVFGLCLAYLIAGLGAAVLLPWFGSKQPRAWWAVTPYAAAWFGSMALLFAAFAIIGVVLGNIVQTSRGLFSILIGAALASHGLVHLEQRVAAGILWRRLGAAGLMSLAVALYVLG